MANFTTELLPYLAAYGALALGVVLLLGALGLPLPSTFAVVTGGALVQQGVLELFSTVTIALLAVVAGDLLCYSLGRLLRGPILARFGQRASWRRAEGYFNQRGALAIFLTRCLLTPIATPVNLIAGSSGYTVRRFLRMEASGQLIWILAYGAVGYLFGSQAKLADALLGNASSALLALTVAGVLAYGLRRRLQPATR